MLDASERLDDEPRRLQRLAEQIRDIGAEIGLPYVAASADISSTEPMRDAEGRPFAETLFPWLDPQLQYWKDRSFALRAPFVTATRYTAEPFIYHRGRYASWRPNPRLDAIEVAEAARAHGIGGALIAPVHLPGGVIGAVTWASREERPELPETYERRWAELHGLAVRFLCAYHDTHSEAARPVRLTRREVQCLKWAAAGKTDFEIAAIVAISLPTVRFHLRNAGDKLGAAGRAQAVHLAATLGYIGQSGHAAAPIEA